MKRRVVCVTWRDAEGGVRTGWRPISGMAKEVVPCKSYGELHEEESVYIVIPHIADGGTEEIGDGEIRIPKDWCISIVDMIEKPKRRK